MMTSISAGKARSVSVADGRVFLVGLMGSGKSTVGAVLAGRLGWRYLDNDRLLQERTGLDAPTLAELGPEALHAQESRQLDALLVEDPPFVAGVAASVADRAEDLVGMAAAGRIVYLRATPTTLARRIGRGRGRPWLGADPLATLTRMYAARDAAYRGAGLVVETDGRNPDEVAAEVDRLLALG
jgi:shikimate kinase